MAQALVFLEFRDATRSRKLELARFAKCSFRAGHAVQLSEPIVDLISDLAPNDTSTSFRIELPRLGIAMDGCVIASVDSDGYVFLHDGIARPG